MLCSVDSKDINNEHEFNAILSIPTWWINGLIVSSATGGLVGDCFIEFGIYLAEWNRKWFYVDVLLGKSGVWLNVFVKGYCPFNEIT